MCLFCTSFIFKDYTCIINLILHNENLDLICKERTKIGYAFCPILYFEIKYCLKNVYDTLNKHNK